MEGKFNHFDENGNAVMVDVSEKAVTSRIAVASGKIRVSRAVMEAIVNKTAKKGDVLGVARVAGIMGTKQTWSLIPMCHPLMLNKCAIDYELDEENCVIKAICTVKVSGKTGVEMEALTGVNITLLTIYDMCKAIDRGMEMFDIHLEEKDGGKSGHYLRKSAPVIAVSGVKNSGKTTFLCGVLPLLAKKGLKVAVLKHDGHSFEPDVEGTDSWRLRKAGASGVAVFCNTHSMMVVSQEQPADAETMPPKWMLERFAGMDLILIEGLKNSSYPKIEIVRKENSSSYVCDRSTLLAIATDCKGEFGVLKIGLDDYEKAAELMINCITKDRQRK